MIKKLIYITFFALSTVALAQEHKPVVAAAADKPKVSENAPEIVFVKEQHELETRLDKWLYFIKHLEDFQNIPEIFNDSIFIQAFEKAEIAKYNADEMYDYQQSLKVFRDNKNTFDYAKETAFDEGLTEGIIKVAKALKQNGVPMDIIIKTTGLSENEINEL